jgi:hypothetical protein
MAVIAMEFTSETAAHAGSTKVAAYAGTAEAAAHVSAAAEPAAHMSATTEAATSPAARKRVSGQSPGESGSRRQDDHSLT